MFSRTIATAARVALRTARPGFAPLARMSQPQQLRFSSAAAVDADAAAFSSSSSFSFSHNRETPIEEGRTVPHVIFKTRVRDASVGGENPFVWQDVPSDVLFQKAGPNKRVVIFSLPGAFTPTCSTTHLPGYEAAYDEIKALGVDEVYCLSVNDAFVMRQWGLHQGLPEDMATGNFQNVKLVPDGAVHFTRGMGMATTWAKFRGFGERSWRYSAVISDMKVEKIFIEDGYDAVEGGEPDPFEVTDAQTMLNYLRTAAK